MEKEKEKEKMNISIKDAQEILKMIQTELHWINSVFNRAGMSPPARFKEMLNKERASLEKEKAELENKITLYYEDQFIVPVDKERVEEYDRKNNKN